jgi:hypothetical protein
MAQEHKATMTCTVLGQLSAFRLSHLSFKVSLKAFSRHRPIAIDPEGLTVRDPLVNGMRCGSQAPVATKGDLTIP